MKLKSNLISILFFICIFTSCLPIKNDTPERLGENVFESIKGNNYEKFKNCFITKVDLLDLLEISTYNTEQKKTYLAESEEKLKKLLSEMNTAFENLKNDGISAGIEWNDALFQNVEYEIKSLHNIKRAEINLNFQYKGLPFSINLGKCYEVKNRWVMISPPKFDNGNNDI
ncbi:MAG: hypothetical protein IPP56_15365 [Bacteroidetes bacterium]|nr:hypothetical protein [Bacteroidota bacterium]MBK9672869.1 hypothetical protein [Bacteroidota bacterium]MBK9801036.1 hypothetical protein [Bacteroidota bacterium]